MLLRLLAIAWHFGKLMTRANHFLFPGERKGEEKKKMIFFFSGGQRKKKRKKIK
jgi:hypothetical protein